MAILLSVVGCSGDPSNDPESLPTTGSASLEDVDPPKWQPVEVDELGEHQPEPLLTEITLDDLRDAADSGSSVVEGERFAVLAAEFLLDATIPIGNVEETVRSLCSESIRPGMRDYIVVDLTEQRQLDIGRRIDTSVSPWLRTDVSVDERSVSVQLNAYTTTDIDFSSWGLLRVDAVWERDAWRITHWHNVPGDVGKVPTKSELDQNFDGGKGWRRLPVPS